MSDDLKAIPRRLIEEVYNQGKLDVVYEVIAAEYVGHDPSLPEDIAGAAAERELAAAYRVAFPDLSITIEDQVAEGDKVVTRLRARGRHEGKLGGIPPSGNEMDVTAVAIHRIADGKIVEHWSDVDSAAMLAQLGLISLPQM